MRTRFVKWLGAMLVAAAPLLSACAGGDGGVGSLEQAVKEVPGRPGICALLCIAPPEGCEYKGGLFIGPCEALSCGHIVCPPLTPQGQPQCPLPSCAPPPEGCRYEGGVTFPCNQVTCGTLVCDGAQP